MWKFDPDGTLTALAPDAHADAGVWVASEQVVFHRAELPPGRQKMWEQTVAFALEEQLAVAVGEQHFAIGRADDGESGVAVAVVSMQLMEKWFDALREKKLKPRAVWPDVLAVPSEKERPVLWHEGGRCLLRSGLQDGAVGSPEWIKSLLEVAGLAERARIFSDDVEALPEAWRERAELLPGSLDERMLAGPDRGAEAMNFLQGAFRPVSMLTTWGKPWRWAGVVVAVVFAFYLATLAAETRIMNMTTASMKQATVALYKRNFSGQQPVTDLRAQVGRRMSQVKGGVVRRETNPWQTLARIESALSSCKMCRVEEVKLTSSSVSLLVSSSAGFDQLLGRIRKLREVKVDPRPLSDDGDRKRLRLELGMEKAT